MFTFRCRVPYFAHTINLQSTTQLCATAGADADKTPALGLALHSPPRLKIPDIPDPRQHASVSVTPRLAVRQHRLQLRPLYVRRRAHLARLAFDPFTYTGRAHVGERPGAARITTHSHRHLLQRKSAFNSPDRAGMPWKYLVISLPMGWLCAGPGSRISPQPRFADVGGGGGGGGGGCASRTILWICAILAGS